MRRGVPYVGDNNGPRRNEMAVVLVIVDGPVRRRDRSNNAPPEKLLEERVDVGESIAVGESGKPVLANDAIEFVLGLTLDVRVHGHAKEEISQR